MQKLRLSTTGRFWIYLICLLFALSLLAFASGKFRDRSQAPTVGLAGAIAYNIDFDMDKARAEKTVEHYGEGIRDLVEDAVANNENNPDAKSTAENTYAKESAVNEALPDSIGESFSQAELEEMEDK